MPKEFGCIRSLLVPIALCLIGLVLTFHPSIFSGFKLSEHDAIDSRLNNYILEHGWRWLLREPLHRSFWNPPIFFPSQNVLAYTDVLLAAAPLYWAWRALGFPIDSAFYLWAVTLAILNFLTTFWFLRRIARVDQLAAAGGAFVFAFSSSRIVQLQHIQLYQHFFTVAGIFAVARLLDGRGLRVHEPVWIGVLIASFVAQFYAGYYLGWFFGFCLLLATLWGFAFDDTRARLLDLLYRRWLAFTLAGGLAGLALWPLASHYLEAASTVGFRPYKPESSPFLYSWIYMSPESTIYGGMSKIEPFRSMPGLHHEHWLGFGLVTSGLAVAGLWCQRVSPGIRVIALAGLSVILVSSHLPLVGFNLWQGIYEIVPGANALSAPSRIGLMLLIPGAVGFALWLNARRTVSAAVLSIAIMVGEQIQTVEGFDRLEIQKGSLASVLGLQSANCDAFFYAPSDRSEEAYKIHVDAMFGQLESGIPTLNGYSGNFPPLWPFHDPYMVSAVDQARIHAQIANWAKRTGLREEKICITTSNAARPNGL